jgi:methionine sulfoxide reductase heme-binding subunit
MNSKALWYLTRGSGVVALILLSAAVILGLVTRNRWASRRWPRFVVESLHRNISLLSTVFMVIHIASSVLDSYVKISWLDAVIPFGAAYKPFWLGMGALSLDIFLAVAITSLVRVRLGYRVWRGVHWLAYACWGLAIVHNLGIGSDRHQTWLLTINLVAIGGVATALAWRILSGPSPTRVARAGGSQPAPAPGYPTRYEGALR